MTVLFICLGIFGIRYLLFPKVRIQSFYKFTGLHFSKIQLDKHLFFFWLGYLLLGVVFTSLSFQFDKDFLNLIHSSHSPFGNILRDTHGLKPINAFIYCFITAGFSEELLFRGLIAKRLISWFGFKWGNIYQALIFWVIHFVLLRLMTDQWVSFTQISAFIMIMPMGLLLCSFNEQRANGSIAPSWLFHGTLNFATFLTLWILVPNP